MIFPTYFGPSYWPSSGSYVVLKHVKLIRQSVTEIVDTWLKAMLLIVLNIKHITVGV
jgi:hypothetical protein